MPGEIPVRPTHWTTVLLLCRKCARKLDGGGYGPKGHETLRTTLREALRQRGQRRDVRVLETRCLGVCPKQSVTAMNASRPDRMFVVAAGTPAEDVLTQMVGAPPGG